MDFFLNFGSHDVAHLVVSATLILASSFHHMYWNLLVSCGYRYSILLKYERVILSVACTPHSAQ